MSLKIMSGGFNKKTLVEYRKDTKNTTAPIIRYSLAHIWNYCGMLWTVIQCLKTEQPVPDGTNRNGWVLQETFVFCEVSTSSCFPVPLRSLIICGKKCKCGAQEGKLILWVFRVSEMLNWLPYICWGITSRSPALCRRSNLEPRWLSNGLSLKLPLAVCEHWLGVAVWSWQPRCLWEMRLCKLVRNSQILDAEGLASIEDFLSVRNEGKCSSFVTSHSISCPRDNVDSELGISLIMLVCTPRKAKSLLETSHQLDREQRTTPVRQEIQCCQF